MSKLNSWAERCYEQSIELYCLERDSSITGLYMTKEKIGNGIPCYSFNTAY